MYSYPKINPYNAIRGIKVKVYQFAMHVLHLETREMFGFAINAPSLLIIDTALLCYGVAMLQSFYVTVLLCYGVAMLRCCYAMALL